ncbi:unnamed protein product [Prorocentrum cordatum]|uniref:Uncharacterized protein n=1 Tax=Prorocentrum cordatum TaxID=2364126 RepID=A0ABN9QSF0_9DINO|nr:unnamed protein product [Polarella glacialis]
MPAALPASARSARLGRAARGARLGGTLPAAARRRLAVAALVPAVALLAAAPAPGRLGCGEAGAGAASPPCAFARWHPFPTGKYKLVDYYKRNVGTFSEEGLEKMVVLLREAFAADILEVGPAKEVVAGSGVVQRAPGVGHPARRGLLGRGHRFLYRDGGQEAVATGPATTS